MTEIDKLIAYLADRFPSIQAESITDPDQQTVWMHRANEWYKDKHATGFRRALVEFQRLQGHRHWSRETTLKHAHTALKIAGLA